jgi:hypothetical protein
MNQLGPDARAILDSARDAHDPDPETRARMRAAVLRRVGAGAVAATTVAATTATSGAAGTATFGGALIAKALVVLAFATGGVVAARELTSTKTAPTAVETNAAAPPVAPTTPAIETVETVMTATVDPEPPPAVTPTVAQITSAPKPQAPKPSTLEEELGTLREAHAALRAGRAADALALVDAMKGSALGPERTATRVLALCALGRADARGAAEKFLAEHPSSPLSPRVRAACAIP